MSSLRRLPRKSAVACPLDRAKQSRQFCERASLLQNWRRIHHTGENVGALRVVRVRKEPGRHAPLTRSISATPVAALASDHPTNPSWFLVLPFPGVPAPYTPAHAFDTTSKNLLGPALG